MAGTAKKILCVILAAVLCMAVFSPAGAQTPQEGRGEIVFVDVGWDSIRLNNAIAGLIAEKVFGYTWTEVPGSTPIAHEALMNGEIDVNMEEWTDNIPSYQADLEAGKFTELGVNFNDNYQGFYIPRYVADEYPDLKTPKTRAGVLSTAASRAGPSPKSWKKRWMPMGWMKAITIWCPAAMPRWIPSSLLHGISMSPLWPITGNPHG